MTAVALRPKLRAPSYTVPEWAHLRTSGVYASPVRPGHRGCSETHRSQPTGCLPRHLVSNSSHRVVKHSLCYKPMQDYPKMPMNAMVSSFGLPRRNYAPTCFAATGSCRGILSESVLASSCIFAGVWGMYINWTSRVDSVCSAGTIVQTKCGQIKYIKLLPPDSDTNAKFTDYGLYFHGAPGSCHQFPAFGVNFGIPMICPSRHGYVGTALTSAESVQDQADAMKELVDGEIPAAASLHVVATGVGALYALKFVQKHKERVKSLVLIEGITRSSKVPEEAAKTQLEQLRRVKPLTWSITEFLCFVVMNFSKGPFLSRILAAQTKEGYKDAVKEVRKIHTRSSV
eukprot:GHVS01105278.1.p1 GENE.GHVS01105278.1~~GHVS01105278.1.p1  ORF type:complete len:343 (+),score=7.72 GHVS01105278.1:126-1154(+)